MAKTEKKVIAIIVEGPTDEDALYGIADDMSDDEKWNLPMILRRNTRKIWKAFSDGLVLRILRFGEPIRKRGNLFKMDITLLKDIQICI